jgi:DNA-binding transcriptional LysR family regulator
MSRELNLDHLRALVTVAELGSFSAAARRLNLTQPAVSLQVRQLEARVGVRLIERLGRHAHPSAAGAALIERARRFASEAEAALADMRRFREGKVGRVRIGTGATACTYLLPPVFRRLRERSPDLEIIVVTGNTGEILSAVEDNRLDLALVTLPVSRPALQVVPVRTDALVGVLPPAAKLEGKALSAVDLARFPLILFERGGAMRSDIDDWLRRGGVEPRPVMEMGNIEAIKQLVGAGLGASVISAVALDVEARAGTLSVHPLRPTLTRTLGLVHRRDKPRDAAFDFAYAAIRTLRGSAGRARVGRNGRHR